MNYDNFNFNFTQLNYKNEMAIRKCDMKGFSDKKKLQFQSELIMSLGFL